MRWIKRLVVGTLSVVIVLVALALIVPFLIPTSTYKDQIETRVKAATGRDLKLGGELKLSILPSLELTANDVVFGNRPGAAQKDMAKLKSLNLKLKLAPLLSGRFEIVALELVEPSIVLEVDKDGKPNWQFDKPAGAPATPAPAKPGDSAQAPARLPSNIFDTLQIETLRIVRGSVSYADARTGAKYDIAKANLEISLPGGARPFHVSGDVDYKGEQVAFKTEVKAPIEMMKGQPSDLAIELSLGDLGKITLQGRAQADPTNPKAARVSGPLKIDVPSVRALAAWAGAPLAPGKAFGPMNFSTTVSYTPDRLSLTALSFKLDDIAATGQLAVAFGPVPTLTGALVIPSLNLTPYMAAGAPASSPAPARPGAAPSQPARPGAAPAPGAISAGPLRAVNADLTIEARQIQAKQFRSALAKLGIKLAGGVLAVTLNPVELYGGTATGTVTVNGARTPLSVNPNLQLKGINGHALLSAVGATDRIDGTLNATANLTGTGADAKAIQNSLNGTAVFQFTNGALRGYNLAGMFRAIGDIKNPLEIIQQVKKAVDSLNKFDPNQKTDFSELSASFRATNGVFNTSDLRMSAPLIRVEGRGSISLPASALDMRLSVKAVPTLQGQGASFAKLGIPIPLRVHGPFSNVAWGLDEKALGDEIRKKAPELIKDQILQKPGDLLKRPGDILKKPGGILDQFRR